MRKIVLLIVVFFTGFSFVVGQSSGDSIMVVRNTFVQHGQSLSPAQLLSVVESNPEAKKEMEIAKSNASVANVLGYAGGFMVGWPIGTMLGGGEPNWTLAGIGLGVILLAIPFGSGYTKHATRAVRIYNKSLQETGQRKTEWHLGLNRNGIGLVVHF
jgi:predicted MFS family arabinose efflux permease